jgi:predicted AlkP superfamily phosphohydrolase/phosphomutase
MTTNSFSGRVLVLGLDMGDGSLIRHWSQSGHLPHFAALRLAGAWLELDSTAQVLHTSTWPTFATGTMPGRHGVYYPYQPKPGYQLARHIEPTAYGVESIWSRANAHGRRAIVYDVPETFPEAEFRGEAVFDWGTWAWYGKPCAQPPELLTRMKSRFGAYPLGLEAKRLAFRVPDRMEERLVRAVAYKAATAGWLLGQSDWDLAVIGLCETHPAGHYLWPAGAQTVGTADDILFEPLLRVYRAIDEAVGALSASLPSDVTLVVLSGDGVRPNRSGWHLLPRVLERLGVTTSHGQPAAAGTVSESGGGLIRRLIPEPARRLVSACLPWRFRDRLGVWLETRRIDWSRTRAFTLPTDLEGCIRVNLKGREPLGIVEPGTQYREVCEEIRAMLEALENPATGGPAVRRVWIRNEVFPGPCQENLPDLIVTWNDEAPLNGVVSSRTGLIEGVNSDPRPGTHSTAGFALAVGPAVRPRTESRAHLADIPASVLALLGIEAASLDGRPLGELTGSGPADWVRNDTALA